MMNDKNKRLFLFVLIIALLAPLFTVNYNFGLKSSIQENNLNTDLLNIQSFSKNDYQEILDNEEQGLGNITINDITFNDLKMGFPLFSEKYPLITNAYNESALNMTFGEMRFMETVSLAKHDNLNNDIINSDVVTVKLNETLNIRYNATNPASEGYLIYGPRLDPCRLLELYVVEEGSIDVKKIDDSNFSIDSDNFLYFDYEYFFAGSPTLNFTMFIIWEYDLSISPWGIVQWKDEGELLITQQEQEVMAKYYYFFELIGKEFDRTYDDYSNSISKELGAKELFLNITINPLDKNLLNNHSLQINGKSKNVNNYLNPDKSFTVEDFQANQSIFFLNFTANFTLKFIDPIEETWAVDRLFSQRDIRERIYFPSLISGPDHIFINYLKIFEKSITFGQYLEYTSLFNRNPIDPCQNASIYEWESTPALLTDNIFEQFGLNINLPFMIKGETCPFSIKYNATEDLKIILMDNIGMPLIGLTVEFYYYGKMYGTYISNENIQPVASLTTDENAEILLKNVPNGYYTINVYQFGILQAIITVSTYKENLLFTSIIHFPSWILIFGLFNIAIFALGYVLYRKNKKR